MSVKIYFGSPGFKEVVEADTFLNLSPKSTAETPDHPAEDGSEFEDTVTRKPRTCSISMLFMPVPLRDGLLPSGASRPEQARRRIMRACDDGEIVKVKVDGDVYYPAVLTSVDAPRANEDGDARRVNVDIKQINVVEGQVVRVPSRRFAKSVRHKGKARDKGTKEARAASALKAQVYEAYLHDSMEAVAALAGG